MFDFITLSCPSCGAKLEITQDIDRFACANCGQEHLVNRSGGIISLSPIVKAINQVGIGVDKTAAELGMVRLQKEIAYLQAQQAEILNSHGEDVIMIFLVVGIGIGILMLLVNLCNIFAFSDNSFGMALGGIVTILISAIVLAPINQHRNERNKINDAEIKRLGDLIASKISQLEQFHNFVSH
jgi:hypothetical protein